MEFRLKSRWILSLILLGLALATVPAPAQSAGTFTATGDMTAARASHTATLLQDGKVLIVGGDETGTAELYDPATGTFTPTGNMSTGHGGNAATLLPDGRVLIVGGSKSELYDPSTGIFSATGNMVEVQTGFTATLLRNGKVLITGGTNGGSDCCAIAANPELYDPSTGAFNLAGSYIKTGATSVGQDSAGTSGLAYAAATLLPDGKVLILSEPAAELYDPGTNTFSLTGSMVAVDENNYWGKPTQIDGRTATLLTNGKVLVAGGNPAYFDTGDFPLSRAELYDTSSGTFMATGSMHLTRQFQSATLLPDGTVLITGGGFDNYFTAIAFAELYTPSTGTFFGMINQRAGREFQQATLLNDGRVLITGGLSSAGYPRTQKFASAEIYTPPVIVPAPVLLSLSSDGKGQGAIQHAGTYRIASPEDPAAAGEYLSIYLTGLADGSMIPPLVAIGGRLAEVTFWGGVPGYPGLDIVNVRMPSGVASGPAVPVRLTYLGRSSNQVTIGGQ